MAQLHPLSIHCCQSVCARRKLSPCCIDLRVDRASSQPLSTQAPICSNSHVPVVRSKKSVLHCSISGQSSCTRAISASSGSRIAKTRDKLDGVVSESHPVKFDPERQLEEGLIGDRGTACPLNHICG